MVWHFIWYLNLWWFWFCDWVTFQLVLFCSPRWMLTSAVHLAGASVWDPIKAGPPVGGPVGWTAHRVRWPRWAKKISISTGIFCTNLEFAATLFDCQSMNLLAFFHGLDWDRARDVFVGNRIIDASEERMFWEQAFIPVLFSSLGILESELCNHRHIGEN